MRARLSPAASQERQTKTETQTAASLSYCDDTIEPVILAAENERLPTMSVSEDTVVCDGKDATSAPRKYSPSLSFREYLQGSPSDAPYKRTAAYHFHCNADLQMSRHTPICIATRKRNT